MDQRIEQTINSLIDWKQVATFIRNARNQGKLDPDMEAAIKRRSTQLGRQLVASRIGLDLNQLSQVEERVVGVVAEYVGIKKQQGSHAAFTIRQLENRGLIGAVEYAVSQRKPTPGFETLVEAGMRELSYEQIAIDFPEHFSPRALWFSRNKLGIPNAEDRPPAMVNEGDDGGAEQKRNPIWSRDELILALDLYLRHRKSLPSKTSNEVLELSEFLTQMKRASDADRGATFRNVNGVYMKLMNFRRLDPEFTSEGKKGLTRGNKDEVTVWDEFAADPARLSLVAEAIRLAVANIAEVDVFAGEDEPDIHEGEEGRILTRLHRVRERDAKLVQAKRSIVLKQTGRLICEACGFDFAERYGEAGQGLIDVHHTRPVHTLAPGHRTTTEDLALLCANCHRVVHAKRRWRTVEEVKTMVRRS